MFGPMVHLLETGKMVAALPVLKSLPLNYLSEIEVELADLKILPEAPLLLIPGGIPPAPVFCHEVQHLLDIFPRRRFCVLRMGQKRNDP